MSRQLAYGHPLLRHLQSYNAQPPTFERNAGKITTAGKGYWKQGNLRRICVGGMSILLAVAFSWIYNQASIERGTTEQVAISDWNRLSPVALLAPSDWGFGIAPLLIHFRPPYVNEMRGGQEEMVSRTRLGLWEIRHFSPEYGLASVGPVKLPKQAPI